MRSWLSVALLLICFGSAEAQRNKQKKEAGSVDQRQYADSLTLQQLKVKAYYAIEEGDFRKAVDVLKQVTKTDVEAELMRGFAYYNLGEADSALYFFDRTLALNESYLPAYLYATALCLEQEAYPLALQYTSKGLALSPEDLNLRFYQGICEAELGNLDSACSHLAKAYYGGLSDAEGYLIQYCYGEQE
jgi:tetratricopeptide (TPR) repeat protein